MGLKALKYQIVISGIIDHSWSAYFSGMTVVSDPAGVTRLTGEITDQSALFGIINKIRDLNIKLISVELLSSDGKTPVECLRCDNISNKKIKAVNPQK